MKKLYLFILTLVATTVVATSCSEEESDVVIDTTTTTTTTSADRQYLIDLYNSADGDSWTNNTNWCTDAALEDWYGVVTNSAGDVKELNLSNNSLESSIPETIGSLSSLETLNLSNNSLESSIPETIGSLSSLETLNLSNNSLESSIPETIGSLSSLETLNLSNNSLESEIPESLGNLSSLETLDLSNNSLSGDIPESLGNLESLETINLSDNTLTGEIPQALVDKGVDITVDAENESTGTTDEASADREVLIEFYEATGGDKWNDNTNWCSDEPLSDWYGVTTDSDGNVTALELSQNGLSGSIPESIGELTNLTKLNLERNSNLSGSILESISSLTKLEYLWLNNNNFTGSIPSSIGNLTNLENLHLGSNSFSGTVPSSIGNLKNLTVLYLRINNFSGSIPENIGNLTKLMDLSLTSNSFSGTVPESIGNLKSLFFLDLSYNNLTGTIPQSVLDLEATCTYFYLDPQNDGYGFDETVSADLVLVGSVYQIYTAAGLEEFANIVGGGNGSVNGTLMNDIDLSDYSNWTPIETFTGTFDGGGYTISNLKITKENDCTGLFGYVSGCTIKNVTIKNVAIEGNAYIGAIVGYAENSSTIENCIIQSGSITSARSTIAGIAGGAFNSSIIDCGNNATIYGKEANVGGIVGYSSGSVIRCYNTGKISVDDDADRVGGIVGCIDYDNAYGFVTACYNNGTVDASYSSDVGGVVGYVATGAGTTITACYNNADVYGASDVGGVVGFNIGTSATYSDDIAYITSCYNTGAVYGSSYVGSFLGRNLNVAYISSCYFINQEGDDADSGIGSGADEIFEVTSVSELNAVVSDMNNAASENYYTAGSPSTTNLPHLIGENLKY